jgi:predicted permease
MGTFIQDLRFGARMLWKKPGFTTIAVVTLALGIGANTAIFSLINALFFQPPRLVEQSDRVVSVIGTREGRLGEHWLSRPDYLYYRDGNTVFSELAAQGAIWIYLTSGDKSTEVYGQAVSWNYFSVLGVRPLMGRFFLPEEDASPGQHPVAVMGYDFWQNHFEGDPDIIGKSVRINQTFFTVIGVAPQGFRGIYAGLPEHIWIPSMMAGIDKSRRSFSRENTWLDMAGRLKPGRTIEEARAELTALASQLASAYPDTNKNLSVAVAPLGGIYPFAQEREVKQSSLLMAATACVLLIACANLASLLLARSASRRKEIAVRLALGAKRITLIRQLLIESLIVSMLGGAAGLLVAVWAKDLIGAFYSYSISELDIRLDPMALGYALTLSIDDPKNRK